MYQTEKGWVFTDEDKNKLKSILYELNAYKDNPYFLPCINITYLKNDSSKMLETIFDVYLNKNGKIVDDNDPIFHEIGTKEMRDVYNRLIEQIIKDQQRYGCFGFDVAPIRNYMIENNLLGRK